MFVFIHFYKELLLELVNVIVFFLVNEQQINTE